jgi:hypothetical protein
MEKKLTISDIEYIYNLAEHKTDEELAAIIKKPVSVIQMQFALMTGLPKRPWEKAAVRVAVSDILSDPIPEQQPHQSKTGKTKSNKIKRLSHADRKIIRNQKQAKKKKEKDEKQSLHSQEMQRLKERKQRLDKSIYATRQLDLTGTIPIKLNDRTTVWVKPGADIEQLKKKYHIA